jgi:hypothetical protein
VTAVTDEETELRVLLERAVPQLPAPAQRLERVRERVRRRARRRAVGLSATAVLAVAAAGLLLPGIGRPSGAPVPAGMATPAPPASGGAPTTGATTGASSVPPTASPTVPASYPRYTFARLDGLGLRLPPGWFTLRPPGLGPAYVSSQQLAEPENGCGHPLDDFCTPLVRRLAPGGELVQLAPVNNQARADKTRTQGRTVGRESVLSACRAVGGTTQLGSEIADGSGSAVLIEATVCLARPTAAQEALARDALLTADFT